jgi:hypothetical protein
MVPRVCMKPELVPPWNRNQKQPRPYFFLVLEFLYDVGRDTLDAEMSESMLA